MNYKKIMKSRIFFFGTFLILVILYITGCRKAGTWLVKKDEPVHADALVILTGSIPDRVLHAVDLYKSGAVGRVIIVEYGQGGMQVLKERGANIISGTEQICSAMADLGISEESITLLRGNAQSTQREAEIVKDYLSLNPGIDTLLIVTSASHTRRAQMIFNNAFMKSVNPVVFVCSPSPYTDFNAEKWWKSKDDIQTVMMEYTKLMNFVLFDRKKLHKKAH